jgi:hypothetical protein
MNDAHIRHWAPSENLAVNEGRSIFQRKTKFQTIHSPKNFGIRIYKLCSKTGNTYDMEVYLTKDKTQGIANITPTHAKVLDKKGRRTWTLSYIWTISFLCCFV